MDGIKYGEQEEMGIVSIDVSPLLEWSQEFKLIDEAFTIAYILKILQSQDPASSSKAALDSIKRAEPSEITHFDPELVSAPWLLTSTR
jgi:hypothetical protein